MIKELMRRHMHKAKRSELPASLPQFKFEKHIKFPVPNQSNQEDTSIQNHQINLNLYQID